jgi:hypothetical protein
MAETLDQLVFLTEAGDINASMAFFTLLQMPWVKPMLIQDMEGFMPEGCLMTDFDTGTVCIDEDEDETKVGYFCKREEGVRGLTAPSLLFRNTCVTSEGSSASSGPVSRG